MSYISWILKGKIIEPICMEFSSTEFPENPTMVGSSLAPWQHGGILGPGDECNTPMQRGACRSANWRIFWYLSNKHGEFSNTKWFFSGNQCLKTDLYIATWFVWKEHLQRNLFASYQIWGFPAMFPLNSFSDSEKSVAVGIWVCWEMGYPQNSDADEKSWQTIWDLGILGYPEPYPIIPNQPTSK